jgi:hypothetical protein
VPVFSNRLSTFLTLTRSAPTKIDSSRLLELSGIGNSTILQAAGVTTLVSLLLLWLLGSRDLEPPR